MFTKCAVTASVWLLSLQLFGTDKKEAVYEQGVLMDLQTKANCHTSFSQGTSKTLCTDYIFYWVRVGEIVYKGSCRERLTRPCSFDYTIHDPVEVRFDGSKMFLKQSDGKEVRMTVESVETLAKSSAQKEPTGTIIVTSVPGDADIFVDGANVGNSPATVKLAPGTHRIEIKAPGFKKWVKEITVLEGAELSLSGTLEKEFAQ